MSKKRIVFYRLNRETFLLLKNELKDIQLNRIGDDALELRLDDVWDIQDESEAKGVNELFILLDGFDEEALRAFIAYYKKYPELENSILVVRTQINSTWVIRDLFREVSREHYLMKKVMKLSKMLKKTNQRNMSAIGDKEGKLILDGFMALQREELVEDEIDKAIEGLVAMGLADGKS